MYPSDHEAEIVVNANVILSFSVAVAMYALEAG